MKAASILSLSALATGALAYTAKETLNCRNKPNTDGAVIKSIPQGTDVTIDCQTTGESINGNNIWDKLSSGCYVADYYIKTGVDGFLPGLDRCGSSGGGGGGGGGAGPKGNDYPYSGSCGGTDPWAFFKCQCTSFVAFRINKRLDINFTNQYKGKHWGNANQWDEAARGSAGVAINKTPRPGCIAQTNAGSAGHVAWVSSVSGDSVTVEEYNWNTKEGYGTRTVAKDYFPNYIHL